MNYDRLIEGFIHSFIDQSSFLSFFFFIYALYEKSIHFVFISQYN